MAFDINLRNPGAEFNMSLAEVVAGLIGAFWGIKVTIQ